MHACVDSVVFMAFLRDARVAYLGCGTCCRGEGAEEAYSGRWWRAFD